MNITVPLCAAGASVRDAQLSYHEREDDQYEVIVTFGPDRYVGVADDFFDALLSVRAELEAKGLLIAVLGASREVWPSAMSRQMGGGLRAYRMVMGKQALTRDLVDIFEASSDVVPVTIRDQMAFRDAWFDSLGKGGEA